MNREAFIAWASEHGNATTVKRYAQSIDAVSAEMGMHNTNTWPGIFEYLIGKKPEKPVWTTDDTSEFNRVYGQFMLMIDADTPDDSLFNPQKYAECYAYTHTKTTGSDNRRLASALKSYRLFLSWKELTNKGIAVSFISSSVVYDSEFYRPDILAAIRAKPFILLAGMSGTGKTRIVRQLARGCCPTGSDLAKDPDHPGNYECIPVRPNWHDSTGLMGYVSRIDGAKYVVTDFVRFLAKAWLYEEEGIPFFLCLDEMNLAPVEQYFAEYLSVIESRRVQDGKIVSDPLVRVADEGLLKAAIDVMYKGEEHEKAEKFKAFFVSQGGIPIPSNFVVMGTVNMDETTCSFPHKVLDRAMTFELNEFDIDSGLESNPDTPLGSIKVENAKGTFTHGWQVYAEAKDVCDKIKPYLVSVNAVLNGTKFKFAYRTRDEVMAYCVERMKDGTALVAALDEATSMKVLSRVEGDEQIVKRTWLEKLQTAIADGLKALCAEGEEPPKKCADKLAEMHKRLVDTGFTSFWA